MKLNLDIIVNYKLTQYLISRIRKQNKLESSKQYEPQ